ncbi:hypothetical protein SPRG_08677 [Saprolegnia parasitica CBS 223.65]|uniref:Peptidase A1 domain-containing protein n=1 Tax=Saprolegnia parasitica (strain CBS 223.65) TaxID=695850 RepID=A0A067C5H3_SAPPC|nr:hypothetical protein SPRG_08677 [Saprolegnia parasitica CBS 223.65]KDO26024.1 hypothetical protein SPRG_08677 [Saprolegnia parasitica CBS 223.65]|eukprot:XP_012203310.1 hypothetical protein SPRG_08677 [Saprolegnia parasitica CBS 223.65]
MTQVARWLVALAAVAESLVSIPLLHEARALSASSPMFEQRVGESRGVRHAALYLGVPPQRALVVIDTASDWTAVVASSCTTCGNHTDPGYDTAKSTTSAYDNCTSFRQCFLCDSARAACEVQRTYVDGSGWTGAAVTDLAYIGRFSGESSDDIMRTNGVRLTVAAQLSASGPLVTMAENGIIGFSKASTTFLAALVAQKRIERNAFSLCYSASGGTLVLGGSDPSLYAPSSAATGTVAMLSSTKYLLPLVDVFVGGTSTAATSSVDSAGLSTLVDSGSSHSYLPYAVRTSFLRAFAAATNVAFSDATTYAPDQSGTWPTITLVFAGTAGRVELELPPAKYMYTTASGESKFGLRFAESGVIGANAMVDVNVLFDLDAQQVGFTRANCTLTTETSTTFRLLLWKASPNTA